MPNGLTLSQEFAILVYVIKIISYSSRLQCYLLIMWSTFIFITDILRLKRYNITKISMENKLISITYI